jgi:hypothetical protein
MLVESLIGPRQENQVFLARHVGLPVVVNRVFRKEALVLCEEDEVQELRNALITLMRSMLEGG